MSNKLDNWMHLSFQELALEIITLFSNDISKSDLKKSLIKAIQHLDIVRLSIKYLEDTILNYFMGLL